MATANPYPIPNSMYQEQRQRIGATMKKDGYTTKHCALIQGGSEIPRNYTDTNYVFKQDAYFAYLFGYEVPDCFGAVFAESGEGIIFIPRLPASYATWMGTLPTPQYVKDFTGVDAVYYVDEMADVLAKHGAEVIHVMDGVNDDSGLNVLCPKNFAGSDKPVLREAGAATKFTIDTSYIYETLTNQRVIKTQNEIDLLTFTNKISSAAHVAVMQHCKPGMSQHHLESTFLHNVYYHGGMRHVSYTCICATGKWNAVLHYPDNDKTVEDGTVALLDMGGEYHCYASDITCSFPVNGKFTEEQKFVYNAVLDAQYAVFNALKPGVQWVDMHRLALVTMCKHLVDRKILIGTVEEIMALQLMRVFQPHGLGHLIGMDVHDVGGYPKGGNPRPTAADTCRLRTARVMEAGIHITVEPGLYFNQVLLEEAFADDAIKKFFNEELIRSVWWNFGGIRIEDDVMVVPEGMLNLTVCPRSIEEVERTMAGASFEKKTMLYKNV